jgi:hypothetical protein
MTSPDPIRRFAFRVFGAVAALGFFGAASVSVLRHGFTWGGIAASAGIAVLAGFGAAWLAARQRRGRLEAAALQSYLKTRSAHVIVDETGRPVLPVEPPVKEGGPPVRPAP